MSVTPGAGLPVTACATGAQGARPRPSRQASEGATPGRPPPACAPRGASRRFGFAHGLGLSLLLHALLVLPWLAGNWFASSSPPPRSPLAVDLFGMVSRRQVQQQQLGEKDGKEAARPAEAQQARTPPPQAAARKAVREKKTRAETAHAAPSPVRVDKPLEKTEEARPEQAEQAEQAAPPSAQPAAAAPPPRGAAEQRVQQTVQARDEEADAIRKYVAGLTKTIRRRLAYPPEAREAGYTGEPIIGFTITESGDIPANSVSVQRSSGHASLDEAAMRAILDSAPLERPPRRMEVTITLSFARKP